MTSTSNQSAKRIEKHFTKIKSAADKINHKPWAQEFITTVFCYRLLTAHLIENATDDLSAEGFRESLEGVTSSIHSGDAFWGAFSNALARLVESHDNLPALIFSDANLTVNSDDQAHQPKQLFNTVKLFFHKDFERTSLTENLNLVLDQYIEVLKILSPESTGGDPQVVVGNLMADILQPEQGNTIYCPTPGTGQLISFLAQRISDPQDKSLIGEFDSAVSARLTALRYFLLDRSKAIQINRSHWLEAPQFVDGDSLRKADKVIAIAIGQYNQRLDSSILEKDPYDRFKRGLPSRVGGQLAVLSHVAESLNPNRGRAAVLVSSSSLFRRGADGEIRSKLINENLIEAVITLPSLIEKDSSTPSIVILNTDKMDTDILFINLTSDYRGDARKASLREDVSTLAMEMLDRRETAGEGCAQIPLSVIKDNHYDLSLRLYVKAGIIEDDIELVDLEWEFNDLERQLHDIRLDYYQAIDEADFTKWHHVL